MATIKRETAKKCRVNDLLNGRYVKREGWEPNYLETNTEKISRANIIGVIISNDETSLTIDDGTGKIQIRNFEEEQTFSTHKIGDLVLVIGRPRVFNEQKYLVSEIVKKIENPKWIEVRMLELGIPQTTIIKEEKPIISERKFESEAKIDIVDSLLQKISVLDTGYGVRIEEILKHFEPTSANATINKLIEQGDIFELKPGVIKII